jgi:hypothetical protein
MACEGLKGEGNRVGADGAVGVEEEQVVALGETGALVAGGGEAEVAVVDLKLDLPGQKRSQGREALVDGGIVNDDDFKGAIEARSQHVVNTLGKHPATVVVD